MRRIKVTNKRLHKLLKDREVKMHENLEISKKMDKLDKDRNKCLYKAQALSDKIGSVAKKENFTLENYEFISQIGLDKDDCFIDINHMIDSNYRTREEIEKEVLKQAKNKEGLFKDPNLANEVKLPNENTNNK